MKHYTYKLTDPITGEFYFGSRSHQDPITDNYMGSYKTWKPEDETRLVKEIIKDDYETREDAIEHESKLISQTIDDKLNRNYYIPNKGFTTYGLDVCSKNSYIKRYGKLKGVELYNERVEKIKKSIKERLNTMSDAVRRELFGSPGTSNPNYGNQWDDNWKDEQSKRMTEYYKNNPASNTGKKFSKNWRNNISESRIKNGIAKGSNNPRSYGNVKITDLDGNEWIFDTAKDAAKHYEVDRHTLTQHCKNKTSYQRGKLKGWKFQIIN